MLRHLVPLATEVEGTVDMAHQVPQRKEEME
jgi:hypothetical protein